MVELRYAQGKMKRTSLLEHGFTKRRKATDEDKSSDQNVTETEMTIPTTEHAAEVEREDLDIATYQSNSNNAPEIANSCLQVSKCSAEISKSNKVQKTSESDEVALKRIADLFPELSNKHHKILCKERKCDTESTWHKQKGKKDKFVHAWISCTELAYCPKTLIWWLMYEEDVGMFCVLCRKHNTYNLQNKSKIFNKNPSIRYKRSAIIDHTKTEQHRTAVTLELTSRKSVFQKTIDERKEASDEVMKAAFFALYWLMKEELPNIKFNSLIKLVEKMGHPLIKHFQYTGQGTEREMMLNIGKHLSKSIVEKVNESGTFGLLVDEVTDISVKQQMVCFIQYIDQGVAKVDFLDIANVLDYGSSADANTLLKVIKNILLRNDLDIQNCSSFVSDGASVMVGQTNGVAAKIKSFVPSLISIHCICHRLALACTYANKEIEYISTIESILTQLWKYFEDSPKRTAALAKAQLEAHKFTAENIPKEKRVVIAKKMKKACKTRWLSFDKSVRSVFEEFPAVLQTLRLQDDATADGLLKRMRSFKFIGALAALSHILPILGSLSKAFQKDTINFSSIQPALDHTMDDLDDLQPKDLNDPFTTDITIDLRRELEDGGRLYELELNPSQSEWQQLARLISKYLIALKENMIARFSSSLPVIECFSIFDPNRMPNRGTPEFKTYGFTSIEKIADHFLQGKDDKEERKEKLLSEWGSFSYELQSWKSELPENIRNPQRDKTLTAITPLEWCLQRLVSNNLFIANHYKELILVAKVVLCLPVSNAWPERGGSVLKRVKTRLRNSIKSDMLAALLQVSINGPEIHDAEDVVVASVEKWLVQKKRIKLPKRAGQPTAQNSQDKVHVIETETEDACIQTELEEISEVHEKQEHVMQLMKQAAKILGLDLCDNGDDDSDGDSSDELDDEFKFE